MFLLLFFIIIAHLHTSSLLLLTTENHVSTRNITCQNGSSSTTLLFNCEACLVITRNYAIRTSLSLTGSGVSGVTYMCLQANEIEPFHENLVRECLNFPGDTLNGYDDFCIASPFSAIRGSYRACMCTTNACNFNYSECVQRTYPYWSRQPPAFSNTIVSLRERIKCYRPYEDYQQQPYAYLTPLCASNDDECKNFVFDQGVLCAISVDRTNQITRQTLPPSIYAAHVLKFKTILCSSFTWASKNIYFTQCQQDETVCMCAVDGCDKDLETCRTNVNTLDDCLYIFYGDFDCLSTLIIDIEEIRPLSSNIDTTKKLSKLKYFSLTSVSITSFYHELVPIFRRMPNVEELRLFLFVKRINSIYIDGIHLNDAILIRMPRLNKFMFSITTVVCNRNSNIILRSNDDIQLSFADNRFGQIGSYADDNTMKIRARCHIYSLPYEFEMFNNVTNSFQGGIFNKVRSVTITDDFRPFENEFFQIISQSFPFLQRLSIENGQPQKYKKSSFTLIIFDHIAVLDLKWRHIDYVEQFLLERKTRLPCLSHLTIQHQSLVIIKNNFANDLTVFNFAQLKTLVTKNSSAHSKYLKSYFPRL